MAGPLYYDCVKDTSSSYNGSTFTLLGTSPSGGTIANFSVVGNGNTCDYVVYDSSGNKEVQTGQTYTASGTTLSRGTPSASTNGGAQVSFSGTVTLELVWSAARCAQSICATNSTGNQLNFNANSLYQYIADAFGGI